MNDFSCKLSSRSSSNKRLYMLVSLLVSFTSLIFVCFQSASVWFLTGPYDKSYPSPSFYNPIPWKPIQVPPTEKSKNKTSCTKPQRQQKCQQSPSNAFRLRNSASAGQLLQRRWHSRLTVELRLKYDSITTHSTTAPELRLFWVTDVFLAVVIKTCYHFYILVCIMLLYTGSTGMIL